MTYPTVNGIPLDQIFDHYVSGTKAPLTGYTVRMAGVDVDLRDLFAPLYLGTSADPTRYKVNNADLNTIFAKKGTATYSLPINGNTYTEHSDTRGTVRVTLNMLSNGTWNVTTLNISRDPQTVVDDSGIWLPAGDASSNWTCTMTNSGTGSVVAHPPFTGENSQSTTCATQKQLSANQNAMQESAAITVGTEADWMGAIVLKLYRLGVLRSTTTIYTDLLVDGN